MSKISLLIFLLLLSSQVYSQQIFISRAHTESGEPVDLITNKTITENQTVSIIFDNGKEPITQKFIFLFIDKINNGSKINLFSKMLHTTTSNKRLVEDYTFTREGNYEIYFTDFKRNKSASALLTVKKVEPKKNSIKSINELLPNLKILFTTRIEDGKPQNFLSRISLNKSGGEVYIYVINDKPLGTGKLLVNIWRRIKPNTDFDQFIDSKKFEIDEEWNDTYFKHTFPQKGEYKINIFNEKEILIKTAYISVGD
ncbi:MAG: hypothetical protein HYS25_15245 [Ignavibacteriales bacterium]|nr:hypothetical protein [Ignavibacteriales bacterium]